MTQFIAGEPHSPRRRPTCKTRFLSRISLEADARIRTADPFITSEVLYQLSYVGGGSYCSRFLGVQSSPTLPMTHH